MNKLLIKIMRAVVRVSPSLVSEKHYVPDARTAQAVQSWVQTKAYCLPDPGIDEVAARLGVDRDQLTDYCNYVLHKNFLTWRKELRIEEAKRLLFAAPDRNLSLLAESLGVDRSNFRRQFQEVTGMPLTEWRRMIRG